MNKCYDYEVYGKYDTAGRPVMGRKCFCGTTACLKNEIQNFGEVETTEHLTEQEMEERFYKKAFATTLL